MGKFKIVADIADYGANLAIREFVSTKPVADRKRNAKMDFLKFSVLIFVICSVNSSPVEVNDLTNGISEFARDFYSVIILNRSK